MDNTTISGRYISPESCNNISLDSMDANILSTPTFRTSQDDRHESLKKLLKRCIDDPPHFKGSENSDQAKIFSILYKLWKIIQLIYDDNILSILIRCDLTALEILTELVQCNIWDIFYTSCYDVICCVNNTPKDLFISTEFDQYINPLIHNIRLLDAIIPYSNKHDSTDRINTKSSENKQNVLNFINGIKRYIDFDFLEPIIYGIRHEMLQIINDYNQLYSVFLITVINNLSSAINPFITAINIQQSSLSSSTMLSSPSSLSYRNTGYCTYPTLSYNDDSETDQQQEKKIQCMYKYQLAPSVLFTPRQPGSSDQSNKPDHTLFVPAIASLQVIPRYTSHNINNNDNNGSMMSSLLLSTIPTVTNINDIDMSILSLYNIYIEHKSVLYELLISLYHENVKMVCDIIIEFFALGREHYASHLQIFGQLLIDSLDYYGIPPSSSMSSSSSLTDLEYEKVLLMKIIDDPIYHDNRILSKLKNILYMDSSIMKKQSEKYAQKRRLDSQYNDNNNSIDNNSINNQDTSTMIDNMIHTAQINNVKYPQSSSSSRPSSSSLAATTTSPGLKPSSSSLVTLPSQDIDPIKCSKQICETIVTILSLHSYPSMHYVEDNQLYPFVDIIFKRLNYYNNPIYKQCKVDILCSIGEYWPHIINLSSYNIDCLRKQYGCDTDVIYYLFNSSYNLTQDNINTIVLSLFKTTINITETISLLSDVITNLLKMGMRDYQHIYNLNIEDNEYDTSQHLGGKYILSAFYMINTTLTYLNQYNLQELLGIIDASYYLSLIYQYDTSLPIKPSQYANWIEHQQYSEAYQHQLDAFNNKSDIIELMDDNVRCANAKRSAQPIAKALNAIISDLKEYYISKNDNNTNNDSNTDNDNSIFNFNDIFQLYKFESPMIQESVQLCTNAMLSLLPQTAESLKALSQGFHQLFRQPDLFTQYVPDKKYDLSRKSRYYDQNSASKSLQTSCDDYLFCSENPSGHNSPLLPYTSLKIDSNISPSHQSYLNNSSPLNDGLVPYIVSPIVASPSLSDECIPSSSDAIGHFTHCSIITPTQSPICDTLSPSTQMQSKQNPILQPPTPPHIHSQPARHSECKDNNESKDNETEPSSPFKTLPPFSLPDDSPTILLKQTTENQDGDMTSFIIESSMFNDKSKPLNQIMTPMKMKTRQDSIVDDTNVSSTSIVTTPSRQNRTNSRLASISRHNISATPVPSKTQLSITRPLTTTPLSILPTTLATHDMNGRSIKPSVSTPTHAKPLPSSSTGLLTNTNKETHPSKSTKPTSVLKDTNTIKSGAYTILKQYQKEIHVVICLSLQINPQHMTDASQRNLYLPPFEYTLGLAKLFFDQNHPDAFKLHFGEKSYGESSPWYTSIKTGDSWYNKTRYHIEDAQCEPSIFCPPTLNGIQTQAKQHAASRGLTHRQNYPQIQSYIDNNPTFKMIEQLHQLLIRLNDAKLCKSNVKWDILCSTVLDTFDHDLSITIPDYDVGKYHVVKRPLTPVRGVSSLSRLSSAQSSSTNVSRQASTQTTPTKPPNRISIVSDPVLGSSTPTKNSNLTPSKKPRVLASPVSVKPFNTLSAIPPTQQNQLDGTTARPTTPSQRHLAETPSRQINNSHFANFRASMRKQSSAAKQSVVDDLTQQSTASQIQNSLQNAPNSTICQRVSIQTASYTPAIENQTPNKLIPLSKACESSRPTTPTLSSPGSAPSTPTKRRDSFSRRDSSLTRQSRDTSIPRSPGRISREINQPCQTPPRTRNVLTPRKSSLKRSQSRGRSQSRINFDTDCDVIEFIALSSPASAGSTPEITSDSSHNSDVQIGAFGTPHKRTKEPLRLAVAEASKKKNAVVSQQADTSSPTDTAFSPEQNLLEISEPLSNHFTHPAEAFSEDESTRRCLDFEEEEDPVYANVAIENMESTGLPLEFALDQPSFSAPPSPRPLDDVFSPIIPPSPSPSSDLPSVALTSSDNVYTPHHDGELDDPYSQESNQITELSLSSIEPHPTYAKLPVLHECDEDESIVPMSHSAIMSEDHNEELGLVHENSNHAMTSFGDYGIVTAPTLVSPRSEPTSTPRVTMVSHLPSPSSSTCSPAAFVLTTKSAEPTPRNTLSEPHSQSPESTSSSSSTNSQVLSTVSSSGQRKQSTRYTFQSSTSKHISENSMEKSDKLMNGGVKRFIFSKLPDATTLRPVSVPSSEPNSATSPSQSAEPTLPSYTAPDLTSTTNDRCIQTLTIDPMYIGLEPQKTVKHSNDHKVLYDQHMQKQSGSLILPSNNPIIPMPLSFHHPRQAIASMSSPNPQCKLDFNLTYASIEGAPPPTNADSSLLPADVSIFGGASYFDPFKSRTMNDTARTMESIMYDHQQMIYNAQNGVATYDIVNTSVHQHNNASFCWPSEPDNTRNNVPVIHNVPQEIPVPQPEYVGHFGTSPQAVMSMMIPSSLQKLNASQIAPHRTTRTGTQIAPHTEAKYQQDLLALMTPQPRKIRSPPLPSNLIKISPPHNTLEGYNQHTQNDQSSDMSESPHQYPQRTGSSVTVVSTVENNPYHAAQRERSDSINNRSALPPLPQANVTPQSPVTLSQLSREEYNAGAGQSSPFFPDYDTSTSALKAPVSPFPEYQPEQYHSISPGFNSPIAQPSFRSPSQPFSPTTIRSPISIGLQSPVPSSASSSRLTPPQPTSPSTAPLVSPYQRKLQINQLANAQRALASPPPVDAASKRNLASPPSPAQSQDNIVLSSVVEPLPSRPRSTSWFKIVMVCASLLTVVGLFGILLTLHNQQTQLVSYPSYDKYREYTSRYESVPSHVSQPAEVLPVEPDMAVTPPTKFSLDEAETLYDGIHSDKIIEPPTHNHIDATEEHTVDAVVETPSQDVTEEQHISSPVNEDVPSEEQLPVDNQLETEIELNESVPSDTTVPLAQPELVIADQPEPAIVSQPEHVVVSQPEHVVAQPEPVVVETVEVDNIDEIIQFDPVEVPALVHTVDELSVDSSQDASVEVQPDILVDEPVIIPTTDTKSDSPFVASPQNQPTSTLPYAIALTIIALGSVLTYIFSPRSTPETKVNSLDLDTFDSDILKLTATRQHSITDLHQFQVSPSIVSRQVTQPAPIPPRKSIRTTSIDYTGLGNMTSSSLDTYDLFSRDAQPLQPVSSRLTRPTRSSSVVVPTQPDTDFTATPRRSTRLSTVTPAKVLPRSDENSVPRTAPVRTATSRAASSKVSSTSALSTTSKLSRPEPIITDHAPGPVTRSRAKKL